MGDIVLQTPLISALKYKYGSSIKISFLTSSEYSELLDGHKHIDRLLCFDRKKQKLSELFSHISKLHSEDKIDLIVDLHATTRAQLIRTRFFYIPNIVVPKARLSRAIKVRFKRGKKDDVLSHPVKLLNYFSSIFGTTTDIEELAQWLAEQTHNSKILKNLTVSTTAQSFKTIETKNFIALAPAASFAAKKWPIEYFVTLAKSILDKTQYDVVVLAGPQDTECIKFNELSEKYDGRIFNYQGKKSISESNELAAQAQVLVGNDTGLIHMAESFGVPTLSLFGPTIEQFGFAPHGKYSSAMSVDLWCRPCSTTGAQACFREKHYCMLNLSAQMVEEKLMQTLERYND